MGVAVRSAEAQPEDQFLPRVSVEEGSIRSSSESRSSTLPTPGIATVGEQLGGALLGELADAQLDPLRIGEHGKGNTAVVCMRWCVRGERVAEDHCVVQSIHRAVGSGKDHRDHATQHRSGQWPIR